MNSFAYRTTSLAIKTLSNLSNAKVVLHGTENVPPGSKIFVINHFTRLETFLIPYYLNKLVKMPIWSLASAEFFVGAFGRYMESVGAVSTDHPDRDRLIVKSLLTNEAAWMIFPEGRMVKSKQIFERGRYIISYAGGKHPPHTGAAVLALRTEFYRQRLRHLAGIRPDEFERLLPLFNLDDASAISELGTYIVPVNLTYYPLRARVNILNKLAQRVIEDVPERLTEELMTEGAMLISGVDIDIRFGAAIEIAPYLDKRLITKDIQSTKNFDFDDQLLCLKCMRRQALKLTQRYMHDIYHMTTVNHDHIFAAMLKHNPSNRIDLDKLKMRAYLAISEDGGREPIYLHNSLDSNQNHLLMDDKHNKMADFLSVAQEKGVIEQFPGYIIRDGRKMGPMLDFHRARVDNPIAVIANEVEPLTTLQRKIKVLCRMPGFLLKRRIVHHLRKQAELEFEADYQKYFLEGESKPREIGRPVLIPGRSRHLGIVLSHGYMAAPAEVRGLADYLGRLGYWVYLPRLKGHGTAPEDLAGCSYKDWIRSMEDGYLLIRHHCRRVVVAGFSAGAALALELAQRVPDIAGVVAIATPLRLQEMASHLAPVVDTWNRLMAKVHINDAKMEFTENHPENPHINYLRNPVSGVRELERLVDFIEPKLSSINVPTIIMHSQYDPVANPKGSERIFQQLGAVEKQYIVFNFPRHGILLGQGAEQVYGAVGRFIDQVADGRLPASPEEKEI